MTIAREEGLDGLFKGIASPLVCSLTLLIRRIAIMFSRYCALQATAPLLNGVVFASYQMFLSMLVTRREDVPTLTQVTIAGFWTGILCAYALL